MKSVHPYLNFDGNTEEAFGFYASVFGTEPANVVRYSAFGMGETEEQRNRIAHMAMPLANGIMLMGSDMSGQESSPLSFGNNLYLNIDTESAEEAERLFGRLSEGGQVEMALEKTEFAEKLGVCADRYGVRWMIYFQGDVVFQPVEGR